jgi:ATP-dependent Clp protease ATP-binding subunit ClpA
MNETAVLIKDGQVISQAAFARHIRHVQGGSELYRYRLQVGEKLLFLYRSGSGKTESAKDLSTELGSPDGYWDSWDAAERDLGLPEGALRKAF